MNHNIVSQNMNNTLECIERNKANKSMRVAAVLMGFVLVRALLLDFL